MVTICTTMFNLSKILRSAQRIQLYVLCGSQNKQRFLPYTELTDVFKTQTDSVYYAVRTGCLNTSIPPKAPFSSSSCSYQNAPFE